MSLQKILFVTLICFICANVYSQRRYGDGDYNRIGITGGLAIFDINTDDFITESRTGFIGGFTTRGSYRNNFDLIYGINFVSNEIGVSAIGTGTNIGDQQFIIYTIIGAQINFLVSYNIVKPYLSIEVGPMLQVNGNMKLKNDRFADYNIDGYTNLTAEDIQDISPINGLGYAGLSVGLKSFKLSGGYQYGFTNTFAKLNDKNLKNEDFKGNIGKIVIAATVYF